MSDQKYIKGMPVRNATRYLTMVLEKIDIENAERQDPENCAFARCLKRLLGVEFVRIDATRAYVESIEDGRSVVDFYVVPPGGMTRAYIEMFDRGENIRDEKGNIMVPKYRFTLAPPSPSQSIGYKRPPKTIPFQDPKSSSPLKSRGVEYKPAPIWEEKPSIRILRSGVGRTKFDRV